MTAIADFRTRIGLMLANELTSDYSNDRIDEGLKEALHQYNNALPLEMETVIVLPGDGREIALNDIARLRELTEVYWPFDSASEPWPPNRVRGWYLYWDDTQPVLYLNNIEGDEPQLNDELRLWYTTCHTIDGLDSATETTIPKEHEGLLIKGAAGYATLSRTVFLTEATSADMFGAGLLATWANRAIRAFEQELEQIKRARTRASGPSPFSRGWKLDKWDHGL